jgi:hypothetical protein
VVRRHAEGRSFADIGCMWMAHGEIAFTAEEAGATAVTAFDAMPETEEFRRRHEESGSSVRFVRGDLHDAGFPDQVGEHDVVWCTGLLYHTPHPALALERLAAIARDVLIVGTKGIPEIPGYPQAAVYFPGLSRDQRSAYASLYKDAILADFDTDPVRGYANWWWGLTPSALAGLAGRWFEVVETLQYPYGGRRDNCLVVGRRRVSIEAEREQLERAVASLQSPDG